MNLRLEKGTATNRQGSYKSLDDLVKVLNDNPAREIEIDGHTEKLNDETLEHQLSKDRAKAVVDYLKSKGVKNLIGFKGLGSSQPVAPNDSEEYRTQNRRVEVVVVKMP